MISGDNNFCEFSTEMACKYGIEIAIILGFFQKVRYLSSLQDEGIPAYPTVSECCNFFKFWDEEKIRHLISALYLNKLI